MTRHSLICLSISIVLLSIARVTVEASARVYPITPHSLRQLYVGSDLVIAATVKDVVALELNGKRFGRLATLIVDEAIKGSAIADVEVAFYPEFTCPASATYGKGEKVLAFLTPEDDRGFRRTFALSYGSKSLDDESHQAYIEALKALDKVFETRKRAIRHVLTIEWLVACAENPLTRAEAIMDIGGPMQISAASKDIDFTKKMTWPLRDRVHNVLLEERRDWYHAFQLMGALAKSTHSEVLGEILVEARKVKQQTSDPNVISAAVEEFSTTYRAISR